MSERVYREDLIRFADKAGESEPEACAFCGDVLVDDRCARRCEASRAELARRRNLLLGRCP